MSSRLNRSTPMSWIVTTLLITLAMFAAFFMLSEWIARRNGGGDDPSATG